MCAEAAELWSVSVMSILTLPRRIVQPLTHWLKSAVLTTVKQNLTSLFRASWGRSCETILLDLAWLGPVSQKPKLLMETLSIHFSSTVQLRGTNDLLLNWNERNTRIIIVELRISNTNWNTDNLKIFIKCHKNFILANT